MENENILEELSDKVKKIEYEINHKCELIKSEAENTIKQFRYRNYIIYMIIIVFTAFGINSYIGLESTIKKKVEDEVLKSTAYHTNMTMVSTQVKGGSYYEALEILEPMFKTHYTDNYYLRYLFLCTANLQDHNKSVMYYNELFEKIGASQLNDVMAINNIAWSIIDAKPLNEKYIDEAEFLLNRAIALSRANKENDYKYVYYNLSKIFLIKKEKENCIVALKKMIGYNPKHYLYFYATPDRKWFKKICKSDQSYQDLHKEINKEVNDYFKRRLAQEISVNGISNDVYDLIDPLIRNYIKKEFPNKEMLKEFFDSMLEQ